MLCICQAVVHTYCSLPKKIIVQTRSTQLIHCLGLSSLHFYQKAFLTSKVQCRMNVINLQYLVPRYTSSCHMAVIAYLPVCSARLYETWGLELNLLAGSSLISLLCATGCSELLDKPPRISALKICLLQTSNSFASIKFWKLTLSTWCFCPEYKYARQGNKCPDSIQQMLSDF